MAPAGVNPSTTGNNLGKLDFYTLPALCVLSDRLSGIAASRNVLVRLWRAEQAWCPGRIEDRARAAVLAGLLPCGGSAASRTAYADLYTLAAPAGAAFVEGSVTVRGRK